MLVCDKCQRPNSTDVPVVTTTITLSGVEKEYWTVSMHLCDEDRVTVGTAINRVLTNMGLPPMSGPP
jgi:hypothetical protein